MGASESARGGEPIDAEWEPAERRRAGGGDGGVSLSTAIMLSAAAAMGGGAIGAYASRAPAFAGALDQVAPAPTQTIVAERTDPELEARLRQLETHWLAVETATGGGTDSAAITSRLLALQDAVKGFEGRIGDADLAALARQVAALQADQDAIRAQSESAANAARAAFAVSAAAEAARSSGPFEQAYATLETILPGDPNIAALAPLARTGAPSRQDLKDQFESLEADIVRAARISTAGAGFWGRLQAFFAQFVTVRRTGEGETPVGMVESASARLDRDDVAGAVAELSRLTGPAAQVASPWIQRARARLEIDARLAAVRAELSRGRST